MNLDPTELLRSLSAIGALVVPAVMVISFVAGLILIGRGGWLMVGGRDGRGVHDDVPFFQVAVSLLIGACLIQLARSVSNTQALLGGAGTEVRSTMAYMAAGMGTSSAISTLALNTALLWVGALGTVGVFRGLLLWYEMGSGKSQGGAGDSFWRGLWHILGGGVCVNIGFA